VDSIVGHLDAPTFTDTNMTIFAPHFGLQIIRSISNLSSTLRFGTNINQSLSFRHFNKSKLEIYAQQISGKLGR